MVVVVAVVAISSSLPPPSLNLPRVFSILLVVGRGRSVGREKERQMNPFQRPKSNLVEV